MVGAVGGGLLVAAIAVAVVVGMSPPAAEAPAAQVAPALLIVNTKKPAKGTTVLVPVATGAVKVAGDAATVTLVGPDGAKAQPGNAVPVGGWQVMATFADGSRANGAVQVTAGGTATVTCSLATKACVAQ